MATSQDPPLFSVASTALSQCTSTDSLTNAVTAAAAAVALVGHRSNDPYCNNSTAPSATSASHHSSQDTPSNEGRPRSDEGSSENSSAVSQGSAPKHHHHHVGRHASSGGGPNRFDHDDATPRNDGRRGAKRHVVPATELRDQGTSPIVVAGPRSQRAKQSRSVGAAANSQNQEHGRPSERPHRVVSSSPNTTSSGTSQPTSGDSPTTASHHHPHEQKSSPSMRQTTTGSGSSGGGGGNMTGSSTSTGGRAREQPSLTSKESRSSKGGSGGGTDGAASQQGSITDHQTSSISSKPAPPRQVSSRNQQSRASSHTDAFFVDEAITDPFDRHRRDVAHAHHQRTLAHQQHQHSQADAATKMSAISTRSGRSRDPMNPRDYVAASGPSSSSSNSMGKFASGHHVADKSSRDHASSSTAGRNSSGTGTDGSGSGGGEGRKAARVQFASQLLNPVPGSGQGKTQVHTRDFGTSTAGEDTLQSNGPSRSSCSVGSGPAAATKKAASSATAKSSSVSGSSGGSSSNATGAVLPASSGGTNVYAASLPNTLGEEALFQMFEPFGSILSVGFMRPVKDAHLPNKAFGFILFADSDAAQRAIEGLNGLHLGTQRIQVRLAKDTPRRLRHGPAAGSTSATAATTTTNSSVASSKNGVAPHRAPSDKKHMSRDDNHATTTTELHAMRTASTQNTVSAQEGATDSAMTEFHFAVTSSDVDAISSACATKGGGGSHATTDSSRPHALPQPKSANVVIGTGGGLAPRQSLRPLQQLARSASQDTQSSVGSRGGTDARPTLRGRGGSAGAAGSRGGGGLPVSPAQRSLSDVPTPSHGSRSLILEASITEAPQPSQATPRSASQGGVAPQSAAALVPTHQQQDVHGSSMTQRPPPLAFTQPSYGGGGGPPVSVAPPGGGQQQAPVWHPSDGQPSYPPPWMMQAGPPPAGPPPSAAPPAPGRGQTVAWVPFLVDEQGGYTQLRPDGSSVPPPPSGGHAAGGASFAAAPTPQQQQPLYQQQPPGAYGHPLGAAVTYPPPTTTSYPTPPHGPYPFATQAYPPALAYPPQQQQQQQHLVGYPQPYHYTAATSSAQVPPQQHLQLPPAAHMATQLQQQPAAFAHPQYSSHATSMMMPSPYQQPSHAYPYGGAPPSSLLPQAPPTSSFLPRAGPQPSSWGLPPAQASWQGQQPHHGGNGTPYAPYGQQPRIGPPAPPAAPSVSFDMTSQPDHGQHQHQLQHGARQHHHQAPPVWGNSTAASTPFALGAIAAPPPQQHHHQQQYSAASTAAAPPSFGVPGGPQQQVPRSGDLEQDHRQAVEGPFASVFNHVYES